MAILRQLVFLLVFSALSFLTGSLLLRLLKLRESLSRALSFGFLTMLAIFQLAAYPMARLQASFSLLFWTYGVLIVGVCAVSAVALIRGKKYVLYLGRVRAAMDELRAQPLIPLFFLLAAAVYTVRMFLFSSGSSDDSYYMARAMETIAQNRLGFEQSLYWVGELVPNWPASSDASTFEYFKACLSAASGINVTVLCRSCFCFFITAVSLCTIYEFVCSSHGYAPGSDRKALITLTLYLALLIVGNSGLDSAAFWMSRYGWQGKSVLCSVVFPALFVVCCDIVRGDGSDVKRGSWVLAGITLLSGVQLSVVGLFLPLVCYFCLGILFMLTRGRKNFSKLLLPVILSVLPVLVFAALTYAEMSASQNQTWETRYIADWASAFKSMLCGFKCFFMVLNIAALIYIASRKEQVSLFMLVGMPVALFLTFLNPLLVKPVSLYVTGGMVYWRLYWLLPIYLTPAYAAAELLTRADIRSAKLFVLGAVAAFALTTYFGVAASGARNYLSALRLCTPYQTVRTNLYSLDDRIIDAADLMLADYGGDGRPTVLSFGEEPFRQYTEKIVLAGGMRMDQKQYMTRPIPGTDMTEAQFYTDFLDGMLADEDMGAIARSMGIDYMYLNETYGEQYDLAGQGFTLLSADSGYELWKCP